jgi:hypothetical protein
MKAKKRQMFNHNISRNNAEVGKTYAQKKKKKKSLAFS